MNSFHLLTAVFGLLATLSMLRSFDLFEFGAGAQPAQLLMAFVMLVSASACLKQARTQMPEQK
jgi:hypothetical protein